MKETLKSKKGITLITLVITIIVLIILAGISIAVLTGEDGLITKAKQGAQNYQNSAIEEQNMLNTIFDGANNGTVTETNTIEQYKARIKELEDTLASLTQSTTATKEDIIVGKTAYSNGEIVTGTYKSLQQCTEIVENYAEETGTRKSSITKSFTAEKDTIYCIRVSYICTGGGDVVALKNLSSTEFDIEFSQDVDVLYKLGNEIDIKAKQDGEISMNITTGVTESDRLLGRLYMVVCK